MTTDFLYDGLNFVQEKTGATVNANLLTGLAIDEVYRRTQGAVTRDMLPDALGSTLALTSSTRALSTQYTYAPYGTTTQTGSANANSQKFTGREDDGTTGLYYYRARYYSPTYSRFVSEDPIGIAGGANAYAYGGGNPISIVDPLGLFCLSDAWIGGISGAAGGTFGGVIAGLQTPGGGIPAAIAFGVVGGVAGGVTGTLASQSDVRNVALAGVSVQEWGQACIPAYLRTREWV